MPKRKSVKPPKRWTPQTDEVMRRIFPAWQPRKPKEGGQIVKVVLEAFNGLLTSAPIDWPDSIGPYAQLPLDQDFSHYFDIDKLPPSPPPRAICRFMATDRYYPLKDGNTARIYALIGLR
jgi:hypothetical protein